MSSPFGVLGLEPAFELDMALLAERHRNLSAALHPDRYAGKPAAERRMALERAIEVNSAWRALRDPVKRAEMLLAEHGVAVGESAEPKPPPSLLMEMMEVRETLSDARRAKDVAQIERLSKQMHERQRSVIASLGRGFAAALATPGNGGKPSHDALIALLPLLAELRYLNRFFEELQAIEDELLS